MILFLCWDFLLFSCVSNVYTITLWHIFTMAALKSLSDTSVICHLSVGDLWGFSREIKQTRRVCVCVCVWDREKEGSLLLGTGHVTTEALRSQWAVSAAWPARDPGEPGASAAWQRWRPAAPTVQMEPALSSGESSLTSKRVRSLFYYVLELIGRGPPHDGELSALLIKMLISSRNTPGEPSRVLG